MEKIETCSALRMVKIKEQELERKNKTISDLNVQLLQLMAQVGGQEGWEAMANLRDMFSRERRNEGSD